MPYQNPVISGFYPDPSVCRVGETYYLVTSSFEFFPGVPLFRSRDLVHWEQIGHCLTRASQLPLKGIGSSGGIYAPTIRHHDGVFYMITTHVNQGKHLIVTATDPAGEWSEPVWIAQEGIDPSLFFDDDGTVYFTWTMRGGIYQAELDIKTGQCLTEPRAVWSGTGGRYPEAPHLYKINGQYYLMLAEGGTEYGHMETIARSETPWGPFEPCPHNPILTHRNLGSHPIQATGHADLIQAQDGRWWAVFLGFRIPAQYMNYHHMGRETFLAPVTWTDDGWPVIGNNGTVELTMDAETLPLHPLPPHEARDDFTLPTLHPSWNFLRNPRPEDWSITDRPGWLRLNGSPVTLDEADSPAFLGRRQQHFNCLVTTCLETNISQDGEEAGLTVLMNERHHYEIAVSYTAYERYLVVRQRIGDLMSVRGSRRIPEGVIYLQIQADPAHYTFRYSFDGTTYETVTTGEARYLSSEVAGGFTGVYFGLYATGNGSQSTAPADFDWFEYQPL